MDRQPKRRLQALKKAELIELLRETERNLEISHDTTDNLIDRITRMNQKMLDIERRLAATKLLNAILIVLLMLSFLI